MHYPWWIWTLFGIGSYALAFILTQLFLAFCRRKFQKQENCFVWYDIRIHSVILSTFPWMMYGMFVLGGVVVGVLFDLFNG